MKIRMNKEAQNVKYLMHLDENFDHFSSFLKKRGWKIKKIVDITIFPNIQVYIL